MITFTRGLLWGLLGLEVRKWGFEKNTIDLEFGACPGDVSQALTCQILSQYL